MFDPNRKYSLTNTINFIRQVDLQTQAHAGNVCSAIIADFKQHNFVDGICHMIEDVGNALKLNFPYTSDDKNELSDGIVFGK